MANTNAPAPNPGDVLNTINGGKTPTLGQVQDHIVQTASGGYSHLLTSASWYVTFVVAIGAIILIAGTVANSSHMKKWGLGAIVVPLIAYAFMFLVPTIVHGEPSWVLPQK